MTDGSGGRGSDDAFDRFFVPRDERPAFDDTDPQATQWASQQQSPTWDQQTHTAWTSQPQQYADQQGGRPDYSQPQQYAEPPAYGWGGAGSGGQGGPSGQEPLKEKRIGLWLPLTILAASLVVIAVIAYLLLNRGGGGSSSAQQTGSSPESQSQTQNPSDSSNPTSSDTGSPSSTSSSSTSIALPGGTANPCGAGDPQPPAGLTFTTSTSVQPPVSCGFATQIAQQGQGVAAGQTSTFQVTSSKTKLTYNVTCNHPSDSFITCTGVSEPDNGNRPTVYIQPSGS